MRAKTFPASGGSNAPPAPSQWPPAGALHIHPGMSILGSPEDVTGLVFANGVTVPISGSGEPITMDADGLHFSAGKYFRLAMPQAINYDGLAVFGRLTDNNPDNNYALQNPINIGMAGKNLLTYRTGGDLLISDNGGQRISAGGVGIDQQFDFVLGVMQASRPDEREFGGSFTVWHNDMIASARNGAVPISASIWEIGKGMNGIIHEGVLLVQPQGSPEPLYPDGCTSEWIAQQLMN